MVIQGDFNLPSGIWDPARNNSSPLSVDLFNHLSDEGFGLYLVFIKDSVSASAP
ncbi:hypothetical protein AX14_010791 [Amanita brunnescens Koide BX004]|nr:hypothetical protein AX14_010791 [Amanita brunnescens Koide BX004]